MIFYWISLCFHVNFVFYIEFFESCMYLIECQQIINENIYKQIHKCNNHCLGQITSKRKELINALECGTLHVIKSIYNFHLELVKSKNDKLQTHTKPDFPSCGEKGGLFVSARLDIDTSYRMATKRIKIQVLKLLYKSIKAEGCSSVVY